MATFASAHDLELAALTRAAYQWMTELHRLGHFAPGEAQTFSGLRSDRWPPEVDLMAAIEKYFGVKAPDKT